MREKENEEEEQEEDDDDDDDTFPWAYPKSIGNTKSAHPRLVIRLFGVDRSDR